MITVWNQLYTAWDTDHSVKSTVTTWHTDHNVKSTVHNLTHRSDHSVKSTVHCLRHRSQCEVSCTQPDTQISVKSIAHSLTQSPHYDQPNSNTAWHADQCDTYCLKQKIKSSGQQNASCNWDAVQRSPKGLDTGTQNVKNILIKKNQFQKENIQFITE